MGRASIEWFDELNLDPMASSLAMGTRALGSRPWLLADDERDRQLALKQELFDERRADVFSAGAESIDAADAVLALIADAGFEPSPVGGHPLERAGRTVQEDLCLMRRRPDGWYLEAASLCFPAQWRLADKIDRHVTEVHGPVPGYEDRLASRVDSLFDRLGESPVWRRNWFFHTDAALYQPDPPDPERLVPAARALTDVVLRSERQTLRLVMPGWILFTIRTQQAPIGEAVADPARRSRLVGYLEAAPEHELDRHDLSVAQRDEILAALATAE